jgi:hypothetical protein
MVTMSKVRAGRGDFEDEKNKPIFERACSQYKVIFVLQEMIPFLVDVHFLEQECNPSGR